MVEVLIPPQLRRLCGGEEAIQVGPGTLGEVLRQLQERFNGVYDRLCQPDGRVRGSVLVLVNDEDRGQQKWTAKRWAKGERPGPFCSNTYEW
jgi:hypothetical protein